jgi:hypothetical protein
MHSILGNCARLRHDAQQASEALFCYSFCHRELGSLYSALWHRIKVRVMLQGRIGIGPGELFRITVSTGTDRAQVAGNEPVTGLDVLLKTRTWHMVKRDLLI